MPFFALDSDGGLVEKFSRQKQAADAYELNNLIHVVVGNDGRVLAGEVPDGVDVAESLARINKKPEKAEKGESGGQRGGRGCPTCKIQMVPGLPAPDDKRLKGTAFRKCPQCDYTRFHPIAHVAMLLAETGWPTYRDTLGGGQRAARRVIELAIEGVPGPEAYAQTVEESKTWENWAPGRTAQRALEAERKAAEAAAKAAEKEEKAAAAAAAKEAKAAAAAEEKAAKAAAAAQLKADKAAAREAEKAAKAAAKAAEKEAEIEGQLDLTDAEDTESVLA